MVDGNLRGQRACQDLVQILCQPMRWKTDTVQANEQSNESGKIYRVSDEVMTLLRYTGDERAEKNTREPYIELFA